MAWEPKEGSGSLFKNDQKGKEKAPGYRGDIMLGGVVYELAAWVKDGKSGKFFSISAKPKDQTPVKSAPQGSIADMDSDIPF